MKNYTFEQLPVVMKKIEDQLDHIETLLTRMQQGSKIENEYVNAKSAALLLNFSLATLYTKVCKREVPYYKQGNRLYFLKDELFDWIKKGKKKINTDIDNDSLIVLKNMGTVKKR